MKKTLIITLILLSSFTLTLLGQDSNPAATAQNEDTISMYYFHTSFRCNTCRTVEAKSKEVFESLFQEQCSNGTATFQAINIEENKNAPLVKKYQVTGQTLLLVKGKNTSNLTNQGFLYAKTNPDKLKEEIRIAFAKL